MRHAAATQPASRYRWVMAAMSLVGHLALGFNLFGIAPVLPVAIDDYGISSVSGGLLVSLPMLLAAGFGVPGGMWVASIGVKRAQLVGWVAMAVLALSFLAPNFAVMLLLRLAYGVGLAMMITSTGPLLMGWFSQREVLVMNSLNTAAVSLGVAIAVAGAALLAQLTDWKTAMSLFGVVGVAGAIAWAVLGRDAPLEGARPAPISLGQTARTLRNRTVILLVLDRRRRPVPIHRADRLAADVLQSALWPVAVGRRTGHRDVALRRRLSRCCWAARLPLRFDAPRAIFIISGTGGPAGRAGLVPDSRT